MTDGGIRPSQHDEFWWDELESAHERRWLAHLLWFVAGFGCGCLAILGVTG